MILQEGLGQMPGNTFIAKSIVLGVTCNSLNTLPSCREENSKPSLIWHCARARISQDISPPCGFWVKRIYLEVILGDLNDVFRYKIRFEPEK